MIQDDGRWITAKDAVKKIVTAKDAVKRIITAKDDVNITAKMLLKR